MFKHKYMNPVFFLEDRLGSTVLYHFIVLNLGGLYYIEQYLKNNNLSYPLDIYIDSNGILKKVIKDAFYILRDKFILLDTLPTDRTIVNIYGESCSTNHICDNPTIIFPYLRELFLSRIVNTTTNLPKRVFIGRRLSNTNNATVHNITIRSVINEEHFISKLKDYNIDAIYLEQLNFIDKVLLFMNAELIISTNSSALTCLLWCNTNVKIIEIINNPVRNGEGLHYKLLSDTLGLKYYRFSDINDDSNGNFIIEDNSKIYNLIENMNIMPAQIKKENTVSIQLKEWQTIFKNPSSLIVQASSMDADDGWRPWPIGMSWQYVLNYQKGDIIQIGDHTELVLLAILPSTDRARRPSGINRDSILNVLSKNGICNTNINHNDYFVRLPSYKFVVSPEGNGIDCHRHYEALIAGCIPIMERNPLTEEKYKGCPILWTVDYSEITPEYLNQKYSEMIKNVYDYSRLFLSYYDKETQNLIKASGHFWLKRIDATKWCTWYP